MPKGNNNREDLCHTIEFSMNDQYPRTGPVGLSLACSASLSDPLWPCLEVSLGSSKMFCSLAGSQPNSADPRMQALYLSCRTLGRTRTDTPCGRAFEAPGYAILLLGQC
jgi:hypothetical protein